MIKTTAPAVVSNSILWLAVVTLLPAALLIGNLSAGQILHQCGAREVFSCMDRGVTTMLDAYDPFGLAKIVRTMVERTVNGN